jgi:hypothetical protein
MDVCQPWDRLISDYADDVGVFIDIRNRRTRDQLDDQLRKSLRRVESLIRAIMA